MNFFQVLPQEKQNLTSASEKQVLQQSSGVQACNFIKKRLQHGCFPVNIPKVLRTAFFTEQFLWLLFNCFSIRKNFKKRQLVEILPLI